MINKNTLSKRASNPVIAIGGSAGSLEALELFFGTIPPDTGMSFIIITHVNPSQKSLLPEILRKYTSMKVNFAADGVKIRPGNIYIKPSDMDFSILHGTFRLFELPLKGGLKLPIDSFFKDLAQDRKDSCAAVILSGTGTDGTLGIKEIKDNLGMVLIQDPKEAKFGGMPQSAIDTGIADYIVPVEKMPGILINYYKNISEIKKEDFRLSEKDKSSLDKIYILLRKKTGQDFSQYKKNTIYRRIERRMKINLVKSISDYVLYLQNNPNEVELLFRELLIGVTEFFRDIPAFDVLKKDIFPAIYKNRANEGVIRVWVAGCSTGEEAYSIAIFFLDYIKKSNPVNRMKVQIFATDINTEAVDFARHGLYPQNIVNFIPREYITDYFLQQGNRYKIKKEVREMIIFSKQDVIYDPPLTKIDLICCRNLLIYLIPEIQAKILSVFHYSLNPEGFIFLGTSESIGTQSELFSAFNSKWKLFKRREGAKPHNIDSYYSPRPFQALMNETSPDGEQNKHSINFTDLIKKTLLEKFTPPCILINEQGDILYFNGKTGNYLEPATGKVNMNIFSMAREGLRYELGQGIKKVLAQKKEIMLKSLELTIVESKIYLDIIISPVITDMNIFLLVVFREFAPVVIKEKDIVRHDHLKESQYIRDLENELKDAKENLQNTLEEMIASQEEQKSTNEELQSINEELQSTNEELMTSREEMQSLNEELMSVNSELEVKISELSESNNDLINLLNNTEIGTIYLDINLKIRRYNNSATRIVNLIGTDIGRPLSDIATNLKNDTLVEDSMEVLKKLVFKESQVQNKKNKWFMTRIYPYRTVENLIDGVVITFSDITAMKELEASLEDAGNFSKAVVEAIKDPLLILDSSLKIISANRTFYSSFKIRPLETENRYIYEIEGEEWNIPELIAKIHSSISLNNNFDNLIIKKDFHKIGLKKLKINIRPIFRENNKNKFLLLTVEEIEGS